MIKIIKFKKRKVLLGIVFFAIYFAIVIGFIFYPEGMMKHLHTKDKKLVQIPFLIVLCSTHKCNKLIFTKIISFGIKEADKLKSIQKVKD